MDSYINKKLQVANEICNEFNLKGKDRWDIVELVKLVKFDCPILLRRMITPRAEAHSLGLIEKRIV